MLLPDHLIIRNCVEMLQGKQPSSDDDKLIRDKIDWSLRVLELYIDALGKMREKGQEILFEPEHQNGM